NLRARTGEEGEPVRRDLLIEVIGRGDAIGGGHVLHHDIGALRQIFSEKAGNCARAHVGHAAGGRADDHAHGLAAERDLILRARGRQSKETGDRQGCHCGASRPIYPPRTHAYRALAPDRASSMVCLSVAITSLGVAISAATTVCTSSPAIGSIGSPRRSASARNAGSVMAVSMARRKAMTRSVGTAGGAIIGKPIALSLETKRKIASSAGVVARSSMSGTSGRSGSLCSPIWTRTLIFCSAIHFSHPALRPDHTTEARPSTSPRSIANWIVLPP